VPNTRISNAEFVRVCVELHTGKIVEQNLSGESVMLYTVENVAQATKLTPTTVRARAKKLREAGVELPKFERVKRSPKQFDVEGLNKLIKGE
jgi:hypothetical protein